MQLNILVFIFTFKSENLYTIKSSINFSLTRMSFSNISKIFSFFALICLSACQTKSLSPFEEAKNPYAHLGVEGYMGAAMTSCLGMAPQGPPIVRKKDGATVIPDDHSPEQSGYFDCVDSKIYESENRIKEDSD